MPFRVRSVGVAGAFGEAAETVPSRPASGLYRCELYVVSVHVASTTSCRRSWFGETTKIVSGAMEMAQLLEKGATVLVRSPRHRNRL